MLGIDSNNNGVRDDVERYIDARFRGYEHANKEWAVAMQYARAAQKILEYGAEKAMTTELLMSNAIECEFYFFLIDFHIELFTHIQTICIKFKNIYSYVKIFV